MAVQAGSFARLPCPGATTGQCGHTYSHACYVPMMPLGGVGIPDYVPSVFKQHHRAEWAHLFAHTCML